MDCILKQIKQEQDDFTFFIESDNKEYEVLISFLKENISFVISNKEMVSDFIIGKIMPLLEKAEKEIRNVNDKIEQQLQQDKEDFLKFFKEDKKIITLNEIDFTKHISDFSLMLLPEYIKQKQKKLNIDMHCQNKIMKSILDLEAFFKDSENEKISENIRLNILKDTENDIFNRFNYKSISFINISFIKESIELEVLYMHNIKNNFITQNNEIVFKSGDCFSCKEEYSKFDRYKNLCKKITDTYSFSKYYSISMLDPFLLELNYKDILKIDYSKDLYLIFNREKGLYSIFNMEENYTSHLLNQKIELEELLKFNIKGSI
tara:strand:- start:32522 stop:33478 length:957 start_codon:yes stop_codon:yes gene_type:complete